MEYFTDYYNYLNAQSGGGKKSTCTEGKAHSKYGVPSGRCLSAPTIKTRRSFAQTGFEHRVATPDVYSNPRAAVARSPGPLKWRNHAMKTPGGVALKGFTHNSAGKLVYKKASEAALKRYRAPGSDSKAFLAAGHTALVKKLSAAKTLNAGQEALLNFHTAGKGRFNLRKRSASPTRRPVAGGGAFAWF